MSNYLKIILTGIKVWVDDKLEDISYITASHLNSLNDRVENVENIFGDTIVESGYSERALYTDHEIDGDIMAKDKLIEHNLRLVVFLAKKYENIKWTTRCVLCAPICPR